MNPTQTSTGRPDGPRELKTILFCADDFGMSPQVDAGILALAGQGRLSATSCMSRGPSFRLHAPRLLEQPIETGLHLNLTEPFAANGFCQPLTGLLRNSYLRRIDCSALASEIEAQLDAFETVLGRRPDYIDGHQHVHQFPVIRDCLIDILHRRYAGHLPWLRSTRRARLAGAPAALRLKAATIELLGGRAFTRLARQAGFRTNSRLLGAYGFTGGETGYLAQLEHWLRDAEAGDLLMCHPAQGMTPGDPLGAQRDAEYAVLSGPALSELLQRYRIGLARRSPSAA
jgi:predicted glycoside hydrolase/deacetylase ChbG (UPF0249 family)